MRKDRRERDEKTADGIAETAPNQALGVELALVGETRRLPSTMKYQRPGRNSRVKTRKSRHNCSGSDSDPEVVKLLNELFAKVLHYPAYRLTNHSAKYT